jgi:sugar/nucleoside kinase (ribokinase family)
MKILGMGNALVDVLALIDNDALLEQLNLPKGSMQLIDEGKLNEINKSIAGLDKFLASGGSASNTIIGIARLGVEAGFLGKIGRDEYGKYFKEDLIRNGVTPHLAEVDLTSGIATTFISKDGERTFGTYLGAAALVAPEDLSKEYFQGYSYFYIEGYLVQNLELIRRAIVLAKEAGSKIILDLASYNVVEGNLAFLQEIIPSYVDILFANEEEALAFTNQKAEDAVATLSSQVEIAIVKAGANGSWIQQGENKLHVPALKVNCVDTTGAGDLYAAGFLYGLIAGKDLYASGEYGTLLAGHVIQGVGAKIKEEAWEHIQDRLGNGKN